MTESPTLPGLDPESLREARKEAELAVGRLRLPLRSRIWRGSAGEFSGAGTGSSMDFQDHRTYAPGDDPRHINWNAYARTGQYSMKLYREEVRPTVELFLDVSASMFVTPEKAARSAQLFYFLAESASRSGATPHLHLLENGPAREFPLELLASHRWADQLKPGTPEKSPPFPDFSPAPLRTGALRVVVSDLLFPGEPAPFFHQLGQRNGKIIVFSPFTPAEANPDWQGNFEFIDPERGSRHPHRIEAPVLKRYLASYRRHFSLWAAAARRHHALLARIPAEGSLQTALQNGAMPLGALEANAK